MSYESRINQSKEKVYHHAIATKIRDMMANLRKSANEDRKRRWIWELLQNAKDASYSDLQVEVEVIFEDSQNIGLLQFKHNGKPFSVDNITFLIEQVSTKDQNSEDQDTTPLTGKFGTGFLTTHLLSEIVDVSGIIKEVDLPYRKFNFKLDRSKKELNEIIQSVNDSLSLLSNLDSQTSDIEYTQGHLNTSFTYQLNDKGIQVARIGLEDLDRCLQYALVFVPKIKKVSVVQTDEIYELLTDVIELDELIKVFTVRKTSIFDTEDLQIVVASHGNTSIAIPIEMADKISIKSIDQNTPRLFCDFPLIGTEKFSFPALINNRFFSPTEPRDGVDLSDNDDSDIERNKGIVAEAIMLFKKLLEYASVNSWQGIHKLADIPITASKDWLSNKWLQTTVVDPLRKHLLVMPIVDSADDRRVAMLGSDGLPNLFFPYARKKEVRDKIWELFNYWHPELLPAKELYNDWYNIIWNACPKLDLKNLTERIQEKSSLSHLDLELDLMIDSKSFMNEYFQLLVLEEAFISEVSNDVYAVIPDQNGDFKKHSQLFVDKGIVEPLKDALLLLSVDIRSELIDLQIGTGPILYNVRTQEEIIARINQEIRNSNEPSKACNFLMSLYSEDENFPESRNDLYSICRVCFKDFIPERVPLTVWDNAIWVEADKLEVKWVIDYVSSSGDIKSLAEKLGRSTPEVLAWLNVLIDFLLDNDYESKLNLKNNPILPNQNGLFVVKDDLFLDDGEIDEELKDIAEDLGVSFRAELLDKRVYLELPDSRTYNNADVANSIIDNILPKFTEVPRSLETKKIFKKLFLWFRNNESLAEKIFSDLFANKHKLYDDEDIVTNMERAEQFNELMNEFSIESVAELRALLGQRTGSNSGALLPVTQEIIMSMGITNIDEWTQALEDKDLKVLFSHSSVPTPDMFVYAQTHIANAKAAVIAHLRTLQEYDLSEMDDETAPTILAGIYKNGQPISIVVRPAYNNEVIVYYGSERDVLDVEPSELWIEDPVEVRQITLGHVLKSAQIRKFPV